MSVSPSTIAHIQRRREVAETLKALIVERLDLPVAPSWITDDQPLFGRGLELDSVDALELVSAIEYELSVAIEDDDVGVFGSINAIIDYIDAHAEGSENEAVAW